MVSDAAENEDISRGPEVMTPPTPTLLSSLPTELIDIILSSLGYKDLKALRQTCKASTGIISEEDIKTARMKLKAQLLADEAADYQQRQPKIRNFTTWARRFPNEYRTYWSSDTISNIHKNYITRATRLNCYTCLENLPRECFTDRQATGTRCLGHKDAKMRFCMNCGVKRAIWEPGVVLMVEHKAYVVCRCCHTIGKGSPWQRHFGVCSDKCWDAVESRRQAAIELGSVTGPMDPVCNDTGVLVDGKTSIELESASTSTTRATRCLRCWGIDHTEKPVDGELGMGLCKTCEAIKVKEVGTKARTPQDRSASDER